MIGNLLTYRGEPPEALENPDIKGLLELFKQQNEVLKVALTTCVIIPEATRINTIIRKESDEDQNPMG